MSMIYNNILPQSQGKSIAVSDSHKTVSDNNINSGLPSAGTLSPNSDVGIDQGPGNRKPSKFRAERTPGMVAVSGYADRAGGSHGPSALPISEGFVVGPVLQRGEADAGYKDSEAKPATGEAKARLKTSAEKVRYPSTNPRGSRGQSPQGESGERSAADETFEHHCRYQLMTIGECDDCDAVVGKVIYCGVEYCPTCSEDWSIAHQRRFSRMLSKAKQIKYVGYLVIEWPDKYRHIKARVYSKEGLRDSTNKTVEILAGKRQGRQGRVGGWFNRGLVRWHYFGDQKQGKYNPHMNILVDACQPVKVPCKKTPVTICPFMLKLLKADLRKGLDCPDLIVNYSYVRTVGKIVHKIKYITRATFKDKSWDEYMAAEIFGNKKKRGFRNCREWGKWHTATEMKLHPEYCVWPEDGSEFYQDIAVLESGCCHECGGNMTWGKPVSSQNLDVWIHKGKAHAVGGGYYKLDILPGEKLPVPGTIEDSKVNKTEVHLLQNMARMRAKWIKELYDMGIDYEPDESGYEEGG